MSVKQVAFCIGCAGAWFILLPLFAVGGGLALLAYALFGEIAEILIGRPAATMDIGAAREIARRLCSACQ
jgi:hypothetical protein